MSFMSIKDPVLRDKTIEEYLALKDRIKQRSMDERMGEMSYQRALESEYRPILQSQQEMRKDIVDHLQPIHEDLAGVNNLIQVKQQQPILGAERKHTDTSPKANVYFDKLRQQDPDLDTSFGIYFGPDNIPRIGDKAITIDADDIIIADRVYHGTPGLWSLITEKRPENYNRDDVIAYKDLLNQTNVLRHNFDPENSNPRASKSAKWEKILRYIWQEITEEESGRGLVVVNDHLRDGKLYVQKNGLCYRVQKAQGDGLFLSPRPSYSPPGIHGAGLFL